MKKSKIAVTRVGAHTILVLRESLTYKNCEELEALLKEVMKGNQSAPVLDCKEVTFMDSMALETLLRMQESMKEQGSRLKIINLNAVCRNILIATRLINQFHVYLDLQEAVRETT